MRKVNCKRCGVELPYDGDVSYRRLGLGHDDGARELALKGKRRVLCNRCRHQPTAAERLRGLAAPYDETTVRELTELWRARDQAGSAGRLSEEQWETHAYKLMETWEHKAGQAWKHRQRALRLAGRIAGRLANRRLRLRTEAALGQAA